MALSAEQVARVSLPDAYRYVQGLTPQEVEAHALEAAQV